MIQLVLYVLLVSAIAIDACSEEQEEAPPVNAAAEALRLVHQTNWATFATFSTDKSNEGYPLTNDLSFMSTSNGDIYFYMRDLDLAAMDSSKDNRITLLVSDTQGGRCTCVRVMISGRVIKLIKNTEEYTRGWDAIKVRDPTAERVALRKYASNTFHFCKLAIKKVVLFSKDFGYKSVTIEEYHAGRDSVDPKL